MAIEIRIRINEKGDSDMAVIKDPKDPRPFPPKEDIALVLLSQVAGILKADPVPAPDAPKVVIADKIPDFKVVK